MAVYLVEIPNNSPRSYSENDVKWRIAQAFEYTEVTIKRTYSGSLEELHQQELYNLHMAAG